MDGQIYPTKSGEESPHRYRGYGGKDYLVPNPAGVLERGQAVVDEFGVPARGDVALDFEVEQRSHRFEYHSGR